MSDRRIDGFFYGLFMDVEVLGASGAKAENPRRAYVDDYVLRIGRRATLVPALGNRVYGMVLALSHVDLERLYVAPGLEEYRPEAVLARLLVGEALPALCYILPNAPQAGEVNLEYAARLRDALTKLEFPGEYVESVR